MSITPGDFRRIREVFEAAMEVSSDARNMPFVENACGGNMLLIGEVQGCSPPTPNTIRWLDAGERLVFGYGLRRSFPYLSMLIGRGGMGEVYRGRDTNLNREVAIKILSDGFARDADRLGRFKREAHILASLNHPNIAAIYGFEESKTV